MNGIHPQHAIERFPAASALLAEHYDLHPIADASVSGFVLAPRAERCSSAENV